MMKNIDGSVCYIIGITKETMFDFEGRSQLFLNVPFNNYFCNCSS